MQNGWFGMDNDAHKVALPEVPVELSAGVTVGELVGAEPEECAGDTPAARADNKRLPVWLDDEEPAARAENPDERKKSLKI
jgi:hypothetical protein